MHRKQIRKEFYIGVGLLAIVLIGKRFFNMPHFISGTLLGLSVTLELIGLIPRKDN